MYYTIQVSLRPDGNLEGTSASHLVKSLLVVGKLEDVGTDCQQDVAIQDSGTYTIPLVLIFPLSRRSIARGKQ